MYFGIRKLPSFFPQFSILKGMSHFIFEDQFSGLVLKDFAFPILLVQWTLEIVDLDIVDSLVLVDKIVLTTYGFRK